MAVHIKLRLWLKASPSFPRRRESIRPYCGEIYPAGGGGTIEVKASYTNIVVRDIGIGIAPDILPHVFDLFTQSQ